MCVCGVVVIHFDRACGAVDGKIPTHTYLLLEPSMGAAEAAAAAAASHGHNGTPSAQVASNT